MATRPTTYPNWTQGGATQIIQPPAAMANQGFTAGQPVAYQYANWLFYMSGQWIQWLDQATYSSVEAANSDFGMRLLGGGNVSYSTDTGVLAWSAALTLSVPGAADSANQIAAGTVTLPSGSIAYVNANIPLAVLGDTTSGSASVANINYPAGIAVGQTVSGTGIPGGTVVTAVGPTSVTLSANATATNTQSSLIFVGTGALTVQVATNASLVVGANTVLLARATADTAVVGVNGSYMGLRNNEQRTLFGSGYLSVAPATAGQALTARTAVYISSGAADGGRTAGALYPVDSSAANGALRAGFVGFAIGTVTSGTATSAVTDGIMGGFSGLTAGALYYADPTTPGGITSVKPTTTGQYLTPVGVALNATTVDINPAQSATSGAILGPQGWPSYSCSDMPSFTAALAAAAANGGGVIVVLAPFVLTSTTGAVLPSNTLLIGRKGASILSNGISFSGFISMQDQSEIRDITFNVPWMYGNPIQILGDRCIVRGCQFNMTSSPSSFAVAVGVLGSGNRLYNNIFSGVLGSSAAIGIQYGQPSNASGVENSDDGSVFLP